MGTARYVPDWRFLRLSITTIWLITSIHSGVRASASDMRHPVSQMTQQNRNTASDSFSAARRNLFLSHGVRYFRWPFRS